ncbi:MAG: histidine kinase [Lachnospiraceae bacterium]
MKIMNKIRGYIIFQGILFLMIIALLYWKQIPLIIIVVIVFFEVCVILYLMMSIGYPIEESQKEIEHIIQNELVEGDISQEISSNNLFLEEISVLVEKIVEQKTRENSVEMFDKQAKLTALQSQINPHFLYNTLESIRGQALMDGNDEIAKMMEALASFFRYSISRKGNLVTLRDELKNIENYMTIQRYRFNNRFSLEIFIDEEDEMAYDYLIPRLIIQPIVENAIFHGLEECLEGGKVEIEVIVTDKNLLITVSDNGQGMDAKKLQLINQRINSAAKYIKEPKGESKVNTGIALPNIHKRIQLLFGEEYGLQVYSTLNQGTDVEITIPTNYERNIH